MFDIRTKQLYRGLVPYIAKFCEERENEAYLRYPIQYAYLYKGPILEWYFKIKYKFESENYRLVNLYTANKKQVYDLGCGYGFLSYYLHLKDKKRQITAIDYDDDKISVAANCYLKSSIKPQCNLSLFQMFLLYLKLKLKTKANKLNLQ